MAVTEKESREKTHGWYQARMFVASIWEGRVTGSTGYATMVDDDSNHFSHAMHLKQSNYLYEATVQDQQKRETSKMALYSGAR